MAYRFVLDAAPETVLETRHEPGETWNGFESPQPTPSEVIAYLDELYRFNPDHVYWAILSGLMTGYGIEDQPMNAPILGVNGFTWTRVA